MKNIVFENVKKAYGKDVIIDDLNLEIKEGERIILLGPSGCGKTTILRMIAGLTSITEGSLYMDGKLMNDVESGERDIAMVFQNYALFPHMTVEDNITYGLKVHKISKHEIDTRKNEVIEMLGLTGLGQRKPKDLSGGQRQRVALARAVVKRSSYFLLDEPLSNLDAQLRIHSRKELVNLHEKFNQTFIYVTHDQIEAMTIGNRVVVLNKGKIQMIDTPHLVYSRPSNIFTAKFIGSPSMNILKSEYKNGRIWISDQNISLSPEWDRKIVENKNDFLFLGIRPEHIKLSKNKMPNSFVGEVKYIENYGDQIAVFFNLNGFELIALSEENNVNTGEIVYFNLDLSKVNFFDYETSMNIGWPR